MEKSQTRKTAIPKVGKTMEASINISMGASNEELPPKATILFDESHNELLRSQKISDDDEVDTWNILESILHLEINCEVAVYTGQENGTNKGFLTEDILSPYKVLALIAPCEALSKKEVIAITNFVKQGGSLLIAQNYQSLYEDKTNRSINLLLEEFGLYTKPLLNISSDKISAIQFKAHYLSSEISELVIRDPAFLEPFNKQALVIASLPDTDDPFLVVVEFGEGRVVAIGDCVIFGDELINEADNKTLALNIFRWLLFENPLDCFDAQFDTQVKYGNCSTFSIYLKNPHKRTRLQNINCLLESDTGALIGQPEQRIRSLPGGGKVLIKWNFEPLELGSQSLRLTIDFPELTAYSPLFFDFVAYFQCIPDIEVDLINVTSQQEAPEIVETGTPFEMKAIVRWNHQAKQIPLQFQLDGSREHLSIEPIGEPEINQWRIIAFDEGDWKLNLKVVPINLSITRLIRAYSSIEKQINNIECNIINPLSYNVYYQVSLLRKELVLSEIVKVPFNLLTPEHQIELIEIPEVRDILLTAIKAARKEKKQNVMLVDFLLENIAPSYSVSHGCCIPYDPSFAEHLVDIVEQNPDYEERIAYNFMSINNDKRFGETWIQQNIAALMLHEKYGHGFFYNMTKIGKQLEILYRYHFGPSNDSEQMHSPYPRLLYIEYKEVIELICDSVIIVNEGFATWLELTLLPYISELIGQAGYRRKDFLFNRDDSMVGLMRDNKYFEQFKPRKVSKYREGCEYFELIEGYFGKNFGPKCAVQAMLKATDINLGITELDGQVKFALTSEQIKYALLEDQSHDARADERLRAIHALLREHQDEIVQEQEKLQCYRSCLHCECPVNGIISDKFNW